MTPLNQLIAARARLEPSAQPGELDRYLAAIRNILKCGSLLVRRGDDHYDERFRLPLSRTHAWALAENARRDARLSLPTNVRLLHAQHRFADSLKMALTIEQAIELARAHFLAYVASANRQS